jgi:hypothetical protein
MGKSRALPFLSAPVLPTDEYRRDALANMVWKLTSIIMLLNFAHLLTKIYYFFSLILSCIKTEDVFEEAHLQAVMYICYL